MIIGRKGKVAMGINVYIREGLTVWGTLLWDTRDDNAFFMEAMSPWGVQHTLQLHTHTHTHTGP